jgi:primosomal protein N' (replication factor Y)
MQYAQVVVKTKTSGAVDIFTYKISPQDLLFLKPGILVSVPFHGRNLEGIVIDLKKSLPKDLSPDKLKKIIKILDPEPIIDKIHLELARWISKYYLASLGETVFENLVPVAKRRLSVVSDKQLAVSSKSNDKRYAISNKPILIHADFETRFKFYLKAIHQAIGDNRQVIIIVPDLSFLDYFQKYLPKNKTIILSSNMTLTERYLVWREIKEKNISIVLGSNSALFAPCQNLGLIIIDQEESSFYKSEQSPRWYLPTVAEKLSELSDAQLILGSITPSIESYFKTRHKKFNLIERPIDKTPVQIINLSNQKKIISYELEEAIDATLKKNGKVILYANRKGEGRLFTCPDCGYNFLCQKCSLPLIPFEEKLVCHHCSMKIKYPSQCPKCKNINLKIIGITIDRVKHLLEKIFPNKKILTLEKETSDIFKLNKKSLDKILSEADIIVGTFYLAKSMIPRADLVGIICADQSLGLPDFRIQERTFSHLLQIIRLGKSAIIQTFIPEHPMIKALQKNSYEDFYSHEIKDRREMHYPPFSKLIRFIYQNSSMPKCQNEAQKFYRVLKNQMAKEKIPAEIFGPAPAFYQKIRGKFRYHLILKSKSNWKPTISKLPKGWIIDVDPQNML